jgi:hypothetical protein
MTEEELRDEIAGMLFGDIWQFDKCKLYADRILVLTKQYYREAGWKSGEEKMETYNIKGKHSLRQFYKSCTCKKFKESELDREALMKFQKCPYCGKKYVDIEETLGIPLGRDCDEDGNGYFDEFIPLKTFIELIREIETEVDK